MTGQGAPRAQDRGVDRRGGPAGEPRPLQRALGLDGHRAAGGAARAGGSRKDGRGVAGQVGPRRGPVPVERTGAEKGWNVYGG